jgi:hypothetical protein
MDTQQEATLAKVRLHWGIFIPAVLWIFGLILTVLPFFFMVHMLYGTLRQLGLSPNSTSARPSLMWTLTLAPYFLIALGVFSITWFTYWKSEITLTNRRLLFRTGFLSRRSGEWPLENVESIMISEPLFGRICGYGTITVTTVGGSTVPLSFLGSPQSFHSLLQKAVSDAKESPRPLKKPPELRPSPMDDDSRYRPKA